MGLAAANGNADAGGLFVGYVPAYLAAKPLLPGQFLPGDSTIRLPVGSKVKPSLPLQPRWAAGPENTTITREHRQRNRPVLLTVAGSSLLTEHAQR